MKNRTLIKLMLVGDAGTGKTAIVRQFTDKIFPSSYVSTIGVDFVLHDVNLDQCEVKLQIWDSAGQDKFKGLANAFYRKRDVFLFVYDLTRPETLKHVEKWIDEVQGQANIKEGSHVIVLVGNKSDLTGEVVVTDAEIEAMRVRVKDKLQLKELPLHKKVSAKEYDSLKGLFSEVAQKALPLLAREEAAIENAFTYQNRFEKKPSPRKVKNATAALATGFMLSVSAVVLAAIFWQAIIVLSPLAIVLLTAVAISTIVGSGASAWFFSNTCQSYPARGSTAIALKKMAKKGLSDVVGAPLVENSIEMEVLSGDSVRAESSLTSLVSKTEAPSERGYRANF